MEDFFAAAIGFDAKFNTTTRELAEFIEAHEAGQCGDDALMAKRQASHDVFVGFAIQLNTGDWQVAAHRRKAVEALMPNAIALKAMYLQHGRDAEASRVHDQIQTACGRGSEASHRRSMIGVVAGTAAHPSEAAAVPA